MERKYKVEYEESGEILGHVFELHNLDTSTVTVRFVVFSLGAIILALVLKYDNPGSGDVLLRFLMKFAVYWIAVFIAAKLILKFAWSRVISFSSKGQGFEAFEQRMYDREEPQKVTVNFYEDQFENVTETKTKVYGYYRVVRILETQEAFGLVYTQIEEMIGGPKGVFGIPKDHIVGGDVDGFRSFLVEKCTKAKGKVKKLN